MLPQLINNIFEIPQLFAVSQRERTLLKVYLWHRLYQSAYQLCHKYYSQYSRFFKNYNQEEDMIDECVIRYLIGDIIATEEYTLEGIANYVRVPLDIIMDLVMGINSNPSLALSNKVIELHTLVRKPVYNELVKTITDQLSE